MKYFSRFFFSIGRQILVFLFLLFLFFLAFTIFNQKSLSQFSKTYSRQTSLIESIQLLKKNFSLCDGFFDSYLRKGNRVDLASFNQTAFDSFERISSLAKVLTVDDDIYLLKSIETAFHFYFTECSASSFAYNNLQSANTYLYLEKFYYAQTVLTYLLKYCDSLLESVIERNISVNEEIRYREKILKVSNGIFIVLLLTAYFSFMAYVYRKLSLPLEQLVKVSRAVAEGDFNQKIPEYDTANSVGLLIHAFNKMTSDIKKMMDSLTEKVKTEEKLLQEKQKNLEYKELLSQARFLALQAQTNPHFLFNTLNSIERTITLGKTSQSIEMIDSLAFLMRYCLSDSDRPVTLGEELGVCREYIHIQQLRFGERIKYEEKLDENLNGSLFLPKFTLQPLIENAIIHGLEPKEEGGKIIISSKIRKNRALIRIFDNGCGMDREILSQILTNDSFSKRIGLKNTKKRLEFQEKTGRDFFRILSRKGKWTMIILSLKIKKG
ncbi:MAG: histidine kinase [Treponema sp.]|nr:histidine kinase [Treponema sp.]